MSKFFICSDLHLEFQEYIHELPDADYAILAGDIFVIAKIKESGTKRQSTRVVPFLDAVSNKYKRIYLVLGNHEYYRSDMSTAVEELRLWLKQWPNILVLDGNGEDIGDDVYIYGTTLWTDYDNQNPISMMKTEQWLSDYRVIKTDGRPILAKDILDKHINQRLALHIALDIAVDRGKKVIIVTHHSPSYQSVHPKYRGDDINGAFHSNLEALFEPDLKLWVHGHIHDPMDYTNNGTRIIANPMGYPGENPLFNPNLVVEI